MNEKIIEHKIRFYTEIVKILITVIVFLTGGLAALFVNLNSIQKISLFVVGLFIEIIVIILMRDLNKEIFCLFKELEDNK